MKPNRINPDLTARIVRCVARCREVEAQLESLESADDEPADDAYDDDPYDDPIEAQLVHADRAARDELIGLLIGLIRDVSHDLAVVLPDGSIACYAIECDGLAIIPPDRVVVVAGETKSLSSWS